MTWSYQLRFRRPEYLHEAVETAVMVGPYVRTKYHVDYYY